MRRPSGLAGRLMTAQVLVIGIGALTLIVTAVVVAPGLFSEHLARTGEDSPEVQHHAEQAFASSFAISLLLATLASLVAAGLVSWFLVRRVADPVAQLADAADAVAAGDYRVQVPHTGFSSEIVRLSDAFDHMATRLADTETTRTKMLANLAHEVRTPLATLEAYIDGMEDRVVPTEAQSWQTMRDQVARLRRLATDLREAAAAEEHALGLVLEPADAGQLAETAVSAARPRYQTKGVALELDIPDTSVGVHADQERMQQVLANLLDNALRHTPPCGHVTVQVTVGDRSVRTQVTDDGDGISPEELEAVFDRFHRADPARAVTGGGGSGLGLTIARAIVVDHGGTLVAQSTGHGEGATFTVTLPADLHDAPRA
ncbi:MAG: HAMP domain-containing histidine kinase [Actinomycetia bacterium]|nr:HAMP domain-containing histidine kinase [Actinomycetes bacterium]